MKKKEKRKSRSASSFLRRILTCGGIVSGCTDSSKADNGSAHSSSKKSHTSADVATASPKQLVEQQPLNKGNKGISISAQHRLNQSSDDDGKETNTQKHLINNKIRLQKEQENFVILNDSNAVTASNSVVRSMRVLPILKVNDDEVTDEHNHNYKHNNNNITKSTNVSDNEPSTNTNNDFEHDDEDEDGDGEDDDEDEIMLDEDYEDDEEEEDEIDADDDLDDEEEEDEYGKLVGNER